MGRRQKETRRLEQMGDQCESGDKPRVQVERGRSCGVWKGELSVCGERSQDENLGIEH